MTDVTTAATIASLRAEVERLKAELQGERDDLDKISHSYGDALVEEAMLTRRIEELKDYNQRLLAENVRLTNEAADLRGQMEMLLKEVDECHSWIDGQDVRSDFPNATAMRAALDRERERSEGLDDDRSHMTLRFNEEALAHFNTLKELERERERCGVLEREVKAWHAAEHLRKDEWHAEFGELVEARWNTARTHALDAAKFGGA